MLMAVGSEEETAVKFGMDGARVRTELTKARYILYEARLKRPKPHLDNKIITSWNGNNDYINEKPIIYICNKCSRRYFNLLVLTLNI